MNIPEPYSITRPAQLTALLRMLKRAVAEGALEQIGVGESPFTRVIAIDDVPDKGPWRDILELMFRVPGTTAIYWLSVETYHGRGGAWERLS